MCKGDLHPILIFSLHVGLKDASVDPPGAVMSLNLDLGIIRRGEICWPVHPAPIQVLVFFTFFLKKILNI